MSDKQFERTISCILETGDKIEYQIYEDSYDFGNYKNVGPHKMVKAGNNPKWKCKNIDNLAETCGHGLVREAKKQKYLEEDVACLKGNMLL